MHSTYLALLVAAAFARASSSTNSTSNSAQAAAANLIPASISTTCSNFLTSLNSAAGVQSCLSPILTSLASSSSVSSICSTAASSGCSDTTLRSWLSYFKGNCSNELITSPQASVVELYDVLYVVKPFTTAVCSKNSQGQYCLQSLQSNRSSAAAQALSSAAQKPLVQSNGMPDPSVYSDANLLFLGANANMDATDLCTDCTKAVMTSYMQWETNMPPANGLANSPFLSSQTALWSAVQSKCPAQFSSGALNNAGATPGDVNSGALSTRGTVSVTLALGAIALGMMAL